MTDAGLQFPCLALSLVVLLSLFAVPAYAASDIWDDDTRDSVTTDGYTVTGEGAPRHSQKVRSIHTWSPATGGVEFAYTQISSSGNGLIAGLGKNPFGYSNSNQEYRAIEYSMNRYPSSGVVEICREWNWEVYDQ